MKPALATKEEIDAFIDQYKYWTIRSGKLHREYIFKDFIEAFGFMSKAAILSEKANHHPEWSNVYKKVVIDLTTHEVGGITERDFELARNFERIAVAR